MSETVTPMNSTNGYSGPTNAQLLVTCGVFALAFVLYYPILHHMVLHWKVDDDYSHGFLVVPLALYFAWPAIPALKRTPIVPSWWGIPPLILGSITLMIGRLGSELMNMRVSFVLTLIGFVILLFGKEIFRKLAFPLCFLFLMIPLPASLLNIVAFPLQLFAAEIAVKALHYLNIPVLLEGNIIHLPETTLFVAEACSGLRSVMSLITLGIIFAMFFRKNFAERIIIVASTIPIAVLVNAFRVALTAVLTYRFGEAAAGGVVHEFQGLITFSLAFALLLLEARFLGFIWPRIRPTVRGFLQ